MFSEEFILYIFAILVMTVYAGFRIYVTIKAKEDSEIGKKVLGIMEEFEQANGEEILRLSSKNLFEKIMAKEVIRKLENSGRIKSMNIDKVERTLYRIKK